MAPTSDLDRERLLQALALAESAIGRTDPNPRVGCVIGTSEGAVLARGATQHAGGAHAEAAALADAAQRGVDVRGATAWVTLEPCSHHGRTPPCSEALLRAGIARVVAATVDPFPQVDGAGLAQLRAAGVLVDLGPPDIARAAWYLNIGFFSRMLRRRPWVRAKVAATLDGRTALADGTSQWITGEAARHDGHQWRQRAGAILTGSGTVLADDPRLDVRLPGAGQRQPLRVVADSSLRTPPRARLLQTPGRVLIAAATLDGSDALRATGAEVVALPGADGHIDLGALVDLLAERAVNEIHVEAGAELTGALLDNGLVDELLLYVAPRLIGDGRGIAALPHVRRIADGPSLEWLDSQQVGRDLRLRLLTTPGALFARGPSA